MGPAIGETLRLGLRYLKPASRRLSADEWGVAFPVGWKAEGESTFAQFGTVAPFVSTPAEGWRCIVRQEGRGGEVHGFGEKCDQFIAIDRLMVAGNVKRIRLWVVEQMDDRSRGILDVNVIHEAG